MIRKRLRPASYKPAVEHAARSNDDPDPKRAEFAKLKRDLIALETRVRALEANALKPPAASPANAVDPSVGPLARTYELAPARRLDQVRRSNHGSSRTTTSVLCRGRRLTCASFAISRGSACLSWACNQAPMGGIFFETSAPRSATSAIRDGPPSPNKKYSHSWWGRGLSAMARGSRHQGRGQRSGFHRRGRGAWRHWLCHSRSICRSGLGIRDRKLRRPACE